MPSQPARPMRLTLRLRLTVLYGLCFLVAGAALLGITYALVAHDQNSNETFTVQAGKFVLTSRQVAQGTGLSGVTGRASGAPFLASPEPGGTAIKVRSSGAATGAVTTTRRIPSALAVIHGALAGQTRQILAQQTRILGQLQSLTSVQIEKVAKKANVYLSDQRSASLESLITESGIALAIMAVLSIALGWLVAGRALRPLRTMNLRAREITEENLHERLGVDTRRDELGDLAATFDGLLGRLDRAFTSQRRFVANASHELRTPVTLQRALVEVALSDPDASAASLRRTCERVLAAGEQQERVIEALLVLARGQAGIETHAPVDLAELAEGLLLAREALTDGLAVDVSFAPAIIDGDAALVERLVANLLDNAIVHNAASHGWLRVQTDQVAGRGRLRVSNGGAEIPPDRIDELFEPFRRLDGERTATSGLGLGLSIVRAIATAHGADVSTRPVAGGGLSVELIFPAPSPSPLALAPVSGEPLRADTFPVQPA